MTKLLVTQQHLDLQPLVGAEHRPASHPWETNITKQITRLATEVGLGNQQHLDLQPPLGNKHAKALDGGVV